MPRSTMPDRRESFFDSALSLRDYAAAAISATTNETAINFRSAKYDDFRVVVDVASQTGYTAGTNQWIISVQVSTGGAYTTISSVTLNSTQQHIEIPLSGRFVESLVPGATLLRISAAKAGTVGNLTYGAYVA